MSNGKRRPPGFGGLDGVGGTSLCAVLTVLVGACQGGAVDGTAGPMGAGDSNGAPAFAPAESVLPRLTDDQYRNAMVDLFGDPIPNVSLEADTQPHLFSTIGASLTTISENGVGSWEQAALDITAAVFGDGPRRTALLGCEPVGAGATCTRDFLERFGFRAWRRPLEQEELTRYVDVARRTANGDPWAGVRYATAGMLTSPFFLYRVELGEIDPERTTRRRYTSYEMASRLALFL
ncbi:MAG: DUF1595 domain-containing protein, partial [Myxococcales bacterium]|nr:DUF1595 domain-containing protein [Myxococcales bacterium]